MKTRSLKERILHAVCFEAMAIAIGSPVAAWIMNTSLFQMGALALMLSTVAMLWNMIYNSGFDRIYPPGQARSLPVRLCHALGFEGGFILIGLPIAAWMLGAGLWQAFMLELGFFLFFLPYTVIYNWIYDRIRERIIARKICHA